MSKRVDPIELVCGVPSEHLLDRLARMRAGAVEDDGIDGYTPGRPWRFIDFAGLTDRQFVQQVHLALLGRRPRHDETLRRSRDIAWGMTRAEIVLRLLASPEGRRYRPATAGRILPTLTAIASALDPLLPAPGRPGPIAVAQRFKVGATAVSPAVAFLKRVYARLRTIPIVGGLAENAVDLLRLRRLRREVLELRAAVRPPRTGEAARRSAGDTGAKRTGEGS